MKKAICRNCKHAIRAHSYRIDSDVKYYCDLQRDNKTKTKRKRIKANDTACVKYAHDIEVVTKNELGTEPKES